MRDGVNIARRGVPAVALVTTPFWPQGDFVARSVGMPDIPRLQLPHPVAASGKERMHEIALEIRAELVTLLQGGR